jgi:hypothetical protein
VPPRPVKKFNFAEELRKIKERRKVLEEIMVGIFVKQYSLTIVK